MESELQEFLFETGSLEYQSYARGWGYFFTCLDLEENPHLWMGAKHEKQDTESKEAGHVREEKKDLEDRRAQKNVREGYIRAERTIVSRETSHSLS